MRRGSVRQNVDLLQLRVVYPSLSSPCPEGFSFNTSNLHQSGPAHLGASGSHPWGRPSCGSLPLLTHRPSTGTCPSYSGGGRPMSAIPKRCPGGVRGTAGNGRLEVPGGRSMVENAPASRSVRLLRMINSEPRIGLLPRPNRDRNQLGRAINRHDLSLIHI